MEMLYYTIDGGRLAGLPGPAFMEWDFARLRKMGYSVVVSLECDRLNTFEIEDAGFEHKKICCTSTTDVSRIDNRRAYLSSTSSSPSHRYRFCFLFLGTPFCSRYPMRIGSPIVASTRLWAILASLWNLPHDWLSSKVQPLNPPHCGTSVVIWAAYMCGFSGYPMTS